MGENSKIEWCDHTFNPVIGCMKVSDGCKFCYAEAEQDKRFGRAKWGPKTRRVRTSPDNWRKPDTWNRKAKADDVIRSVFCASLSDVGEDHPDWVEPRRDLVAMIERTTNLRWLLLTKRIGSFMSVMQNAMTINVEDWFASMGDRVWVGTSIENQDAANERIPEILKMPKWITKFLSMEPLLGPVNSYVTSTFEGFDVVTDYLRGTISIDGQAHVPCNKVNWVIAGGESGTHARPMHPDWVRAIRDKCVDAGTPFLFKQWGAWLPYDVRCSDKYPQNMGSSDHTVLEDSLFAKVGKHASGRLLDGQEWNQFPQQARS